MGRNKGEITRKTAVVERNRVEKFPKTKEEEAKPDMMPKTPALLLSETLSACIQAIHMHE